MSSDPQTWKGYDKRLADYYYHRRTEYSVELQRAWSMKECPYDPGSPAFYRRDYSTWGTNVVKQ